MRTKPKALGKRRYADTITPEVDSLDVGVEDANDKSATSIKLPSITDQNELSWILYFSRAAISDKFGTTDISVVFKEESSSFEFIARDSVTFVEKRTRLPFHKAGAYMYKMNQQELDENKQLTSSIVQFHCAFGSTQAGSKQSKTTKT